jgi:hypothetical protein
MVFKIENTDKIQVNLTGVGFGLLYQRKTNTTLLGKVMCFHVSGLELLLKKQDVTFSNTFILKRREQGGLHPTCKI